MPKPAIDVTEAAMEAARNLGITDEEVVDQPDDTVPEKETPEGPEPEGEEPEGEEPEDGETTPPKKPSKSIPIERFNEVYGKMKQMERALQYFAMEQQRKEKEVPPEKELPEPDLEEMTNKELANHLLRKLGREMKGALQDAIAPLTKYVGESVQEKADSEVAACAGRHPDYWDYSDRMVSIANRHPTLSAEEVYMLAKGDKASVARSVTTRVKEKMQLKKKANVEKRSAPSEKVSEDKEFKNIREAGLAAAKKLGMI